MAVLYFTQSSLILNWASASSWQPQQVPTLGDYCIFDSLSATCSLNTIGTVSQIDFTNYTKQFRFNTNTLLVYGTVSFGNQMSFSFSTAVSPFSGYNLAIVASASITSNGCTVAVPFLLYNRVSSNNFYTIVDNLNVSENFSTGAAAGSLTHTINGATISLYKNFAINSVSSASTTLTTGTSNIIILGAGTITAASTVTGGLGNNFIIQSNGSITFPTNLYYRNGTFSYISGTLSTGTLNFTGACSINLSGSNSNNVTLAINNSAVTTVTLQSDCHITTFVANAITYNGFSFYIYTSAAPAGNAISGTTTLRLSGTSSSGTVTLSSSVGIGNDIVINTPGNVSIPVAGLILTPRSGGSSFTYTSGNVSVLGLLQINGPNQITLDTSTLNWLNVYSSGTSFTLNLNSTLNVSGLLYFQNQLYTFTGSNGFIASQFQYNQTPATTRTGITLKPGITYRVTLGLLLQPPSNAGAILGIKSSTLGQQANFILSQGASQACYHVVSDSINSSGGQPIYVFRYNSTTQSTNTNNWYGISSNTMQHAIAYIN